MPEIFNPSNKTAVLLDLQPLVFDKLARTHTRAIAPTRFPGHPWMDVSHMQSPIRKYKSIGKKSFRSQKHGSALVGVPAVVRSAKNIMCMSRWLNYQ
mmetsp:Transcript_60313/g.95065  ORF Transcript_60313/g.95065 Transcript_60313/m.95065 type:complete len:97 (-) Transcript_60313:45-335(-)